MLKWQRLIIELKCIIKTLASPVHLLLLMRLLGKFKLTYGFLVHSTVHVPLLGVFVSEESLGKESGAV